MAASVLTLFCDNPQQSGSSAGLLTLTQPAASTSTTGWTVAKGATGYSAQTYGIEKEAGTFAGPQQPSGAGPQNAAEDSWRISTITSGQFSAGTWYSSVSVIGVSSGGDHDGRALFRIWRSPNADGTGATQLSGSIMTGTVVTNLSTSAAQSSAASVQIAASNVTDEYLFLQVAWQRTGAGGANSRDVLIRLGSLLATSGSGLVTSAFSIIAGGAPPAQAGYYNAYYQSLVGDLI